ncbi:MAG: T9SS type A sorting domain-containing protein [Cytophagales bacterium]|nr:T9SS type A sorting domain-containing protein [Cytophagales bacterium]
MRFVVYLFFIPGLFSNNRPVLAQKEANNWYFGSRAAITFSRNAPQELHDNQMYYGANVSHSYATPASISDRRSGALLFYSDSETVWNSDHQVMPNGQDLSGGFNDAMNTAYSVPDPSDTNRYYLFTIYTDPFDPERAYRKSKVHYSVIDMRLDNGRGDIDARQKNILLQDSTTMKIAAIPHANGRDYWLLLHEFGNNVFSIYAITASGVHFSHRIAIGNPHLYHLPKSNGYGQMKASPNNRMLASTLVVCEDNSCSTLVPFEIFDFDNATGILSNVRNLGHYAALYGVSFSPNSKLVYVQGIAVTGKDSADLLYQLNLEDEDPVATRTGLLRNNPAITKYLGASYSLQLGPDGRLYGGNSREYFIDPKRSHFLYVINDPNRVGHDCDVEMISFKWADAIVGGNLPNYIQSVFKDLTPTDNPNAACTADASILLKPNPATGYIEIEIAERCFSPYYLTIYNALGQFVSRRFISDQHSGRIDVRSMASGVYLAAVELPGQMLVKKFVK